MLELKDICVSFRSERQDKLFGTSRDQVPVKTAGADPAF